MQVHRYYDRVAGYLGKGTTYMTPTEARKIGEALIAAADNVESHPDFSGCNFSTVEVIATDPEFKNK